MDVVEVGSPPSLLPLYARAVLPRRGGGGGAVPDRALRLTGLRPEADHVAAYARLVDDVLTGDLPLTYPHLLGVPLQMQLMAAGDFPFPAVGLVHVANVIEQRRPLPVGAPLDVTVRATGPHPHPRGRTVDLLTEVALDGEPAWTSTSTYLRRGGGDPGAAGPRLDVDEQLATTAVRRLGGDLGRRYAAVSGDVNPIHLHPLSARLLGFPRAIAHGMWTAGALAALVANRLPDAVRYTAVFRAPVLLPGTVEIGVRTGETTDAVMRSPSGRTHVLGRFTTA